MATTQPPTNAEPPKDTQPKQDTPSAMLSARAAMWAVVATLIALIVTSILTFYTDYKQRGLTEQGQITDRFSTAVEQLASKEPDTHLGGIYALERIMRESRPDQPGIVEILYAFVHKRAANPCNRSHPETDVRAALNVLGRRDLNWDKGEVGSPDLHNLCLKGADLTGSTLIGADLTDTDLTCARLSGVHLDRAKMVHTEMGQVSLRDATLTGAILDEAVLNDADLRGSDFAGAILTRVDLTRVDGKERLKDAKVIAPKLKTDQAKPCAK